MALLSLWFWLTILVGGVMTIDVSSAWTIVRAETRETSRSTDRPPYRTTTLRRLTR